MKNWIKAISVVSGIIVFLVGLTVLLVYYPEVWIMFVAVLLVFVLCIVVIQLKREFDTNDKWKR